MDYCLPLHQITSDDALNALRDINRDPGSGTDSSRFMLLTENQSVCRSFLFQAAVSYSGKGMSTLYICRNPMPSAPPSIHGMLAADYRTVQMLRFAYLPTAHDLLDFLTGLHCFPSGELPDCVVLDDLTGYALTSCTMRGTYPAADASAVTNTDEEKNGSVLDARGRELLPQVITQLVTCLDDAANFLYSRNRQFSLTVSASSDVLQSSSAACLYILRSFVTGLVEDREDGSVTVKVSAAASQRPQKPSPTETTVKLPVADGQKQQQPPIDAICCPFSSGSPFCNFRLCFAFKRMSRKSARTLEMLYLYEVAQPLISTDPVLP